MPLSHIDYSGFFPFTIFNDADITAGPTTPKNVQMALASMCKAFWLAKSADWDIDVSWSNSSEGISGTVSGSGTADFSGATPQQRAVPPGSSITFPANPLIYSEGLNWTVGASSGSNGEFDFAWFSSITLGTAYPSVFVTKDTSGNFLSAAQMGLFGFGGPELSTCVQPGISTPTMPLEMIVDGVSCSVPLFITDDGFSASGTISVNFNEFWTP